jgi:anion-transporting  ArsA/GET3 family ATPase
MFFTGASGVGKSAVIATSLQKQKDAGTLQPITINMSA